MDINSISTPQLDDDGKMSSANNAPEKMKSWQDRLSGGRTAWSSTVTVGGQNIAARYWYDGQYVNNAKEDAAEIALSRINVSPALKSFEKEGIMYPETSLGYWTDHTVAQPDRARKPGMSSQRVSQMSDQGFTKFASDLESIGQEASTITNYRALKLSTKCELAQAMGRYRPNSALSDLFTLTGTQFNATALSCGEYLEKKFPRVAAKLLSRVQKELVEYTVRGPGKSPSSTNKKENAVQDSEDGQDGFKIKYLTITGAEEPAATLEP
ncbi:hypothetical protein N7478_006603 [Penicillium angulare]|uniref:uncharacterized protein n=1 Tax=Penicillium angulare TaxID=116970 RepID=UPI002540AA2E|nr:uncharacterized protein N7478_006603 [Penicillium angulare]KAJ5281231.1 hypothetical protein N7478_006603 [Penicillium angulare]